MDRIVPESPDQSERGDRFQHDAAEALQPLRASMLRLIEAIPEPVERAADLERALGLNAKLAWQIFRLAGAANPLEEAAQVPRPAAMRRVLDAARRRGVAKDRIERVRDAAAHFDAFVAEHADDRGTFEAMLTGLAEAGRDEIDLHQRRTAFRANSHIWGVQAKAHLSCAICAPGRRPDLTDLAIVRGMKQIRRLRPNVPIVLSRYRPVGVGERHVVPEPIDPPDDGRSNSGSPSEANGPSLLEAFCSEPLPKLITRKAEHFVTVTELAPGPVGNAGAADCYLGGIIPDLPWQNPGDRPNTRGHVLRMTMPTETVILDTLFDSEMFGRLTPQTKLLGSLDRPESQDPATFKDAEQLPVAVRTEFLGRGPAAIHCREIPRYADMLDHVCKRLGWDPERFHVYRCRLEFPVLHGLLMMRFPLPDSGNW